MTPSSASAPARSSGRNPEPPPDLVGAGARTPFGDQQQDAVAPLAEGVFGDKERELLLIRAREPEGPSRGRNAAIDGDRDHTAAAGRAVLDPPHEVPGNHAAVRVDAAVLVGAEDRRALRPRG